jgi:hypothetical protein
LYFHVPLKPGDPGENNDSDDDDENAMVRQYSSFVVFVHVTDHHGTCCLPGKDNADDVSADDGDASDDGDDDDIDMSETPLALLEKRKAKAALAGPAKRKRPDIYGRDLFDDGGKLAESPSDVQQPNDAESGPENPSSSAGAPPSASALAPSGGSKYIPPALRVKNKQEGGKSLVESQVQKSVSAITNRISENNFEPLALELVALYSSGTIIVNEALAARICDLCAFTGESRLLSSMMFVLGALVSFLHQVIGNSVGACVIEKMVTDFHETYNRLQEMTDFDEGSPGKKKCENYLIFLVTFLHFSILGPGLLFDILDNSIASFTELDVEFLLILLRHGGAKLRGSNPTGMKAFILAVNQKVEVRV